MKKSILLIATALSVLFGCGQYDDSEIRSDINDLKGRMEALEQQCKKMNENLSSIQTIVASIQSQDGIVSVTELPNGDGYSILFTSGKLIYIYNGSNGADGSTPIISVRQDTDGIYYWTVDGDWLVIDGRKVRADGIDGKDGKDAITPKFKIEDGFWYVSYDNGGSWAQLGKAEGAAGKDGEKGEDGKDAVTPKFKIEDGFWYVSYDDGASWSQLGKAEGDAGKDGEKGEDGKDAITTKFKIEDGFWYVSYDDGASWSRLGKANGEDGKDGKDADNYFKSITVEDGYVIFVMNDSAQTVLRIPLASTVAVSSIKYVPERLDGMAEVDFAENGGKPEPGDLTMRFEVFPPNAVKYIAENWKDNLVAKIVYVASTRVEIGDFAKLEIKNVECDKDYATISVTMDAKSLDESFFRSFGSIGASLRLFLKMGNKEVSSDYVPLTPNDVNRKVIEYVSVNGHPKESISIGIKGEVPEVLDYVNHYYEDHGKVVFHTASPVTIKLVNDSIASLNFASPIDVSGMSFKGCGALKSIDFHNVNTENVTSMGGLFYNCKSLTSLDLSKLNTENVTSMGQMFYGCSSLTSLDLSNLNIKNVTYMYQMFANCSKLVSLKLSDTSNMKSVKMINSMFLGCSSLTSLDLININTDGATDMSWMFAGCRSLTSLDLSHFNTRAVRNMRYMFSACRSLTSLDLSNFVMVGVNTTGMFNGCDSLKKIIMRGCNDQTIQKIREVKPEGAEIIID